MVRSVAGAVLGAVVWFFAITALGFLVRIAWPEIAAVKQLTDLTLPMLVTRLSVSALGSIAGGLAAALAAGERFRASLGAGVLLLAGFVPYHFTIWNNFPVWYHLTFLVSLPLLSVVGGRLAPLKTAP